MKTKINKIKLRYGENPNQSAYLVNNVKNLFLTILVEKTSYNNLIDVDSGLRCLEEFRNPLQ